MNILVTFMVCILGTTVLAYCSSRVRAELKQPQLSANIALIYRIAGFGILTLGIFVSTYTTDWANALVTWFGLVTLSIAAIVLFISIGIRQQQKS